jgi:hypothetical protein
MMGREPGGEGDYKTADYVAREFARLGLRPAGENGGYFQVVPFFRAAPDPASTIAVGGSTLTLGRDFVPVGVPSLSKPFVAQAVYGGRMTDSAQWPSAEQVRGKLVVFDVPRTGTAGWMGIPGSFLFNARWAQAAGIAVAELDAAPGETRARLLGGRLVLDTARNGRSTALMLVTTRAAAMLLGADPGSLAPGAVGATVQGYAGLAVTPVPYPARNVVAILPGSDPALRGEYVALTAHNDHVGFDHSPVDHDSLRAFNRVVRPMGADSRVTTATPEQMARVRVILDSLRRVHTPRLDSIRNGADDDGSGTASILEIAEAMVGRGARPKRSILFVSHTGEESGLVGSGWFTDHPTVPIDSIVAEIDQDMVGRGTATDLPDGGPTYLEVVGARRLSNEFGDMLEAANARQPLPFRFNYEFDAPGHPLQYYCRADHYNYARYGIPSVAFSRGEHLDYHQVTDEAQYIDYADMARVSQMVYDAALVIANSDHRPRLDKPKNPNPHAPCRQ